MHPGDRVDVETGFALTTRRWAVQPGAQLVPPPGVARPEDQDVALSQVHVLGLLACLQLGARHRVSRVEPFDSTKSWNVEEDAFADDASRVRRDVLGRRAEAGDNLFRLLAVVGEPAI